MAAATRSKKADIPTLPLTDRTLSSLTQTFKLLADESRLRILLTLAREGETHVSALCEMLGQSQPAVSHHLTLMRMAGLVGFRREGKFNFYRMDAMLLGDLLERLFADAGRASAINMGEFSLSFSRNTGRRR
jgi:ArsR family transcriptional regulator, arsenate/arsenite/antimonite-responsive transcriptional repressor